MKTGLIEFWAILEIVYIYFLGLKMDMPVPMEQHHTKTSQESLSEINY